MELFELIDSGLLGDYQYCEITQIILQINGEFWNYFTHIHMTSDIYQEQKKHYLTKHLKTLKSGVKVAICKQILSANKITAILNKSLEQQIWEYDEDIAKLDGVFLTDIQFIPETDPSGNIDADITLTPIEYSLYGSNYSGGYYIADLFSKKDFLYKKLDSNDIVSIQNVIKEVGLPYDLLLLSDRIGNIVCKLEVDVIGHRTRRLSPEKGIAGEIRLNEKYHNREISCYIMIMQENDNTIISNKLNHFILNRDNPVYEYNIEPNRYCNRIMVIDSRNEVTYYSSVRDYTFVSDYSSFIPPQQYGLYNSKRYITIQDKKYTIDISHIAGLGDIYVPKEVYEIEKRQQNWKDTYNANRHYFASFKNGENDRALQFIRDIVNSKDLLWDLKEIWLVDPYLSAYDIISTVVFVSKMGVAIRCLTDLRAIQNNKNTQIEKIEDLTKFQTAKKEYKSILEKSIPKDTDIKIEFRTVFKGDGSTFHDRYLICKYGINKCRAWSLGISVNALGKSHHIIQIVESPNEVFRLIQDMWEDANGENELIFKI